MHAHKPHSSPDTTPALLLSLSHTLDDQQAPLARQARRLAHKIGSGDRSRPTTDAAAFCLAELLEAADAGDPWDALDDAAVLCSDFDA